MIKNSAIAVFQYAERHPFRVFFSISLILSLWSAYADDVINNDGILYLGAASSFAEGQWQEAFAIYKWPAYSIVIGAVQAITGLESYYSAQIVNSFFDATTATIFIAIARLMGANSRGLIAAGAIIVCHLWVNEMRAMIVRDHGYITLYMLAVYFFFKDQISPYYRLKMACVAAFMAACLFRIEGLVFVATIPVYYWFSLAETRAQKIAAISTGLVIAVCLPFGTAFWKSGSLNYLLNAINEWRFDALNDNFTTHVLNTMLRRIELLREGLFAETGGNFAWIAYFGIIFSIAIAGILKSVTVFYGSMAVYAVQAKHVLPNRKFVGPLFWLAATNILILLVFVSTSLFIDWRFGTALSVTLALPATFTLIKAYRFWWLGEPENRFPNILVPTILITLVIAYAIYGLPQISRYRYVKSAAEWVQQNVDSQQALISNNGVLMYYAYPREHSVGPLRSYTQDPETDYWIRNASSATRDITDFDFIAIDVRKHHTNIVDSILRSPDSRAIATFQNTRGDRLTIIKIEK